MNTIKRPLRIYKQEIELKEYRRLVFLHAPALGRLLDSLDAGVIPEPLEVMTALSEGVAYFTDGVSVQDYPDQLVDLCQGRFCPCC